MLIHLHIPKTAGSALNHYVLLPSFSPNEVFRTYGDPDPRGRFKAERAQRDIKLVAGHCHYRFAGLHLERETRYLSVLRDPVDRFVSMVNFKLQRGRHPSPRDQIHSFSGELLIDALMNDPELKEKQSDVMTKQIAGHPRRQPANARTLREAKKHLSERRYLWDVHHRFDAFVHRLNDELGLRKSDAPAGFDGGPAPHAGDEQRISKILPKTFTASDLTARMRAAVEDMNALDLKLYEWAMARRG